MQKKIKIATLIRNIIDKIRDINKLKLCLKLYTECVSRMSCKRHKKRLERYLIRINNSYLSMAIRSRGIEDKINISKPCF